MPRGRKPSLCLPFYPAVVYSLSRLFSMKPRDDDKHCLHLGERCTINLFLSLLLCCGSGLDCGFLKSREKHKPATTASQYYTFSCYLWAPIKTHAFYVLILCPLHLCILNVTERLSINLLRCNLSNIIRKDIKCTGVHEWCATFNKQVWVFVPTQVLFLFLFKFIYLFC